MISRLQHASVEKAVRLREAVVGAVQQERWSSLPDLLAALAKLQVNADVLAKSGIGIIVNDVGLWRSVGEDAVKRASEISAPWKSQLAHEHDPGRPKTLSVSTPFGG